MTGESVPRETGTPLGDIPPHGRGQGGTVRTPVGDQARGRHIQVVLGRDCEAQVADPGKVVRGRNEPVLDGPPPVGDGSVLVGLLVGVQNEIDRRVPHRMGRHPPAALVQALHHGLKHLGLHGLEPVVVAALTPGLFVGLAHPSALEPSVHAQLHAPDPDELGAVVGARRPGVDHRVDGGTGRLPWAGTGNSTLMSSWPAPSRDR